MNRSNNSNFDSAISNFLLAVMQQDPPSQRFEISASEILGPRRTEIENRFLFSVPQSSERISLGLLQKMHVTSMSTNHASRNLETLPSAFKCVERKGSNKTWTPKVSEKEVIGSKTPEQYQIIEKGPELQSKLTAYIRTEQGLKHAAKVCNKQRLVERGNCFPMPALSDKKSVAKRGKPYSLLPLRSFKNIWRRFSQDEKINREIFSRKLHRGQVKMVKNLRERQPKQKTCGGL